MRERARRMMITGYEQVRSVVAALSGDWVAARDTRLVLPETGVCHGLGIADEHTTARPVPAGSTKSVMVPPTPAACCG